jgi:hypothetical protein
MAGHKAFLSQWGYTILLFALDCNYPCFREDSPPLRDIGYKSQLLPILRVLVLGRIHF